MYINKLFAFSIPIKNLLNLRFSRPVCIFGKTSGGVFSVANEQESILLTGSENLGELVGKPQEYFISSDAIAEVKNNDQLVIQKKRTQLFIERGRVRVTNDIRSFLSIKAPLYNLSNHVQGIAGICFCLDQFPLVEILAMINESHILSPSAPIAELFINNFDCLTAREQQCAGYLIKGIRTKGIARMLGISPRTVEKHIENMKIKLSCYSQSELIEKLLTDNLTLSSKDSLKTNQ